MYTVVSNKDAHGRKDALAAIVWGTKAEVVADALRNIPLEIFPNGDSRPQLLAKWYRDVEESGFDSFKVIARTFFDNEQEILNFFDNRATNASAESFNAKIKAFRAQLRGVTDDKYFLFRLQNIYA